MADLLTVKDLRVKFKVHGGTVDAVKGASLTIRKGSTVALVGESGSGKSVISQCIMGILPEVGEIVGGEILFADPLKNGEIVDLAKIPQDSRADARNSRRSGFDYFSGTDDVALPAAHDK